MNKIWHSFENYRQQQKLKLGMKLFSHFFSDEKLKIDHKSLRKKILQYSIYMRRVKLEKSFKTTRNLKEDTLKLLFHLKEEDKLLGGRLDQMKLRLTQPSLG